MPGPGEPMWLPEDTALALAYERDQRLRCGTCNQRRDEWVDARGFPLRHPKFKIATRRCPSCEQLEVHEHAMRNRAGNRPDRLFGLKTVIVPADAG
jgi:hypothetical protein